MAAPWASVQASQGRPMDAPAFLASLNQWQPVTETGFDHDQLAVFVWRSERTGGDTKTPKSRRTLALANRCVAALREQKIQQAADGPRCEGDYRHSPISLTVA